MASSGHEEPLLALDTPVSVSNFAVLNLNGRALSILIKIVPRVAGHANSWVSRLCEDAVWEAHFYADICDRLQDVASAAHLASFFVLGVHGGAVLGKGLTCV